MLVVNSTVNLCGCISRKYFEIFRLKYCRPSGHHKHKLGYF